MTTTKFTRRDALRVGGATLLSTALAGQLAARPSQPQRVLYFTKSSGFEHSVVHRPNGQLSHSERILIEIGRKLGMEITASKDGRLFDGDHLQFDAYVFYTSGDLTTVGQDGAPAMSRTGKQALLDAVSSGKGFMGIHAATDTFRRGTTVDPFIAMLGGEFISHGAQQKARMTVVNQTFPGLEELGAGFELYDEWYAMKHFAPDMHVLLVNETQGMEGNDYQRPPFPGTWARRHGQGKVYYTSIGHREDVWESPLFEKIVVGALRWVTGLAEAEVPANLTDVTPGANQLTR